MAKSKPSKQRSHRGSNKHHPQRSTKSKKIIKTKRISKKLSSKLKTRLNSKNLMAFKEKNRVVNDQFRPKKRITLVDTKKNRSKVMNSIEVRVQNVRKTPKVDAALMLHRGYLYDRQPKRMKLKAILHGKGL